MTKSMDFLYKSSERLGTWVDYVPFYLPPKIVKIVENNLPQI